MTPPNLPKCGIPVYVLLIIFVSAIFSSCISYNFTVGTVQEQSRNITLATLQTMMEDGQYTRVYTHAYNFIQSGKFSKQEGASLLSKSLESMYEKFDRVAKEGLEAKNIALLTGLYNSFLAISVDPPMEYTELLALRRDAYLKDDTIPLLMSSLIREKDFATYPSEKLRDFAAHASTYHQFDIFSDITSILDKRGVDYSDIVFDTQDVSYKDMVKGTVTVFVNKGPDFRNGVALIDRSLGTGFFIDYQGHIITNYHVIKSEVDTSYEGYTKLYVRPSESQTQLIPARVVSYDKVLDIALLKVEIRPNYVFPIAQPVSAEVGEPAIALGSPIGLYNTVTSGIISASERELLPLGTVFQFDAPAYPGSSGGPLVSQSGNVIGVVFAGVGSVEGLNFALEVDWLNAILERLYYQNQVEHPWLGLALQQDDNALRVIYVAPNAPAAFANVEQNDILLSINTKTVSKITEAQQRLSEYQAGTIVRTRWKRNEKEFEVWLTTEKRPYSPVEVGLSMLPFERLLPPLFGTEVEVIERKRKSIEVVIKEVYPGSYAEFLGFQEDDDLTILKWEIRPDERRVAVLMNTRQRQDTFLTRRRQLVFYLDINIFL